MLSTLTLPTKPKSDEICGSDIPYADENSQPLDILLVEDSFSDALLTRFSLDATHIPYKLSTLHKGTQVLPYLNKYRRELPDLILLDLGMPGMDGFEVLDGLATFPPAIRSIPVVILTAYSHFDYVPANYPASIVRYLNKPCDAQEMREVLLSLGKSNTKQRVI